MDALTFIFLLLDIEYIVGIYDTGALPAIKHYGYTNY